MSSKHSRLPIQAVPICCQWNTIPSRMLHIGLPYQVEGAGACGTWTKWRVWPPPRRASPSSAPSWTSWPSWASFPPSSSLKGPPVPNPNVELYLGLKAIRVAWCFSLWGALAYKHQFLILDVLVQLRPYLHGNHDIMATFPDRQGYVMFWWQSGWLGVPHYGVLWQLAHKPQFLIGSWYQESK